MLDDVKTNRLTELLKYAPTILQSYLTDYIKQESGSTTRDATKQVDTLFGNTELSYLKNNGEIIYFTCGQELAKRVANGNDLTEIKGFVDAASKLELYFYLFSEKQTTVVHVSPTKDDPTFGFKMKTDNLHTQFYMCNASKKLIASSI